MLRSLRNAFISGLVLLLPLGVTVIVVHFLLERVGSPASKVFFQFLDSTIRDHLWFGILLQLLSVLIIVLIITFLGFLSNYFLGKFCVGLTERFIEKVPFVNTVYRTVKQIVDTFKEQKRAVFQNTVLVEYPRKGVFALGFLTGEAKGEVQDKTGKVVVNVFVPTTPNPTSGFLLMIDKQEVTFLEMSVSDGMKLIISGGAFVPKYAAPQIDDKPAS